MPRADPHTRHRTHEERLTADLPMLLDFPRLPLTPFTEPQMSKESSKEHDATKARLEDSHILPRRRQKRQQKQSNCLASVNQFCMAFATLSTDSVYNERKHPGKAGKDSKKLPRKSIQ